MLARRLTTILPAMTLAEAMETTRIHRVAGRTGDRTALVTTRPFRAPPPHHLGRRADRRRTGAAAVGGVAGAPRRAHESARRIAISLARSSHVLEPPVRERGVYGHSPDDRTLDQQSGSMFDRSCSGTIDTEGLVT
jgi:Magnesium chelatase, subunit ChlI